ncbi:MAG: PTS sugar transporter subunit IIA [Sedimentisphaerales bacterium]|nr:PTS sugar transporter subunit IIA [Sedimentisphaerales bacterium]
MTSNAKISEALELKRVLFLYSSNKDDVLRQLIDCLSTSPQVTAPQELARGIFYREKLMSTGIGMGIGVPHIRLDSVRNPVMSVALCRNPVADYESLDGNPVQLIFMIATGIHQQAEYLKLLSSISSMLKDPRIRDALINAADVGVFYRILTSWTG